MPISVNLSVSQFVNNKIVKYVKEGLEYARLSAKDIEFEVTENIMMQERKHSLEILQELKKMGFKISIDDFGVEYSSLKYIKMMPIDKIKIDKSFVDGIGNCKKDEAIIKSILSLAKNLELSVVAEGIEIDSQMNFLKENMCNHIQGYYYFRPMPAKELEILIENKEWIH